MVVLQSKPFTLRMVCDNRNAASLALVTTPGSSRRIAVTLVHARRAYCPAASARFALSLSGNLVIPTIVLLELSEAMLLYITLCRAGS